MKKISIFVSLLIVVGLLTACGPAQEAVVEEAVDEAILTVGEAEYSQNDLESLGTLSVDYTDKDGETTTFEGVLLADLLADAGADDGVNVTFTAADGFSSEITMEEILACTNCIVAFDGDSLRTVMPDFGGKLNVKDLVDIDVN